jgi:Ca2+-binding RTX toxin-like protein
MHEASLGTTQGAVVDSTGHTVVMFLEDSYNYSTFHASRAVLGANTLESSTLTVYGTDGTDYISTGTQADTIYAGSGNDQIYAKGGADAVYAGDGNDVLFLDSASLNADVLLDGGAGSNTLNFGPAYNLNGTNLTSAAISLNMGSMGVVTNFQNIVGSMSADTITGDTQNNVLIGSGGADTLSGGNGADVLFGDYDPSDSGASVYGLRQYDVNNNEGNDNLFGGAGNDTLVGNKGDDTLDGGTGADNLTGGVGADTFVIRTGDGGSAISGADVITDFADSTDIIDLTGGLTFGELRIFQGSGDHLSDTIIQVRSSSEYLAILTSVNAANITDVDFE